MTKFVRSSLPLDSIKLEMTPQIENRVRTLKKIYVVHSWPEKDTPDRNSSLLEIKGCFLRLVMSGGRREDLPS